MPDRAEPDTARGERLRLLLVSSNGAGMGHITRIVAMARHAAPGVEVHVVSMSAAVPLATQGRYAYEYIPSAMDLGIGSRRWNAIFARRFGAVLRRRQPDVVVFDGAYPYPGLLGGRAASPRTQFVWSRRGMWQPGKGATQLAAAGGFDLVLEPGECAAEADRGLTAGREDAVRVRPVVLLDEPDLLSREQARRELGLDPDQPAALVTLGAGNLVDIRSELGAVVDAVLASGGWQVGVTRPVISSHAASADPRVHDVRTYPLSRYVRAFDAAVSTAGYNSFHESLAYGLPTAFVASTTQLDDQRARAEWADRHGVGLLLDPLSHGSLARAVSRLGDEGWRSESAAACREVWPGNGAADAMAIVCGLATGPPVTQGPRA